jgi:surface protein
MGNMFSSCYALQSIPQFDTRKITTFSAMCLSNTSLRQMLGPFTATLVTTFSSMFSSSYNLSRCQITGTNQTISFLDCNLGGTEIDEIFSGLSASGAGKTITMTGNWGTSTATRSIATTKGWTVVL